MFYPGDACRATGELFERMVSVAKHAPNQDKRITVHAITFAKGICSLFYRFTPVEAFCGIFHADIKTPKTKNEQQIP